MAHSIDLDDLSRADLKQLQSDIDAQLEKIEKDERKAALEAAQAAARDAGFSLEELVGGTSKSGKSKSAPKYRDPETGKTWTGRGRRPEWIKNAGDDLSKFAI